MPDIKDIENVFGKTAAAAATPSQAVRTVEELLRSVLDVVKGGKETEIVNNVYTGPGWSDVHVEAEPEVKFDLVARFPWEDAEPSKFTPEETKALAAVRQLNDAINELPNKTYIDLLWIDFIETGIMASVGDRLTRQ